MQIMDLSRGEVKLDADADGDGDEFGRVKRLKASLTGERLRPGCRVQLKINEQDDAAMAEKDLYVTSPTYEV